MKDLKDVCKIAVVQAAPVLFDKPETQALGAAALIRIGYSVRKVSYGF